MIEALIKGSSQMHQFSASCDARLMHQEIPVRTTINLDEELVAQAMKVTGTKERTMLIHEGLRALIARESAKRLAKLGGSDRSAEAPPRRRS